MSWANILKAKDKKEKKPTKELKEKGPKNQKVGDGDTAQITHSPKFVKIVNELKNWVSACESVDIGTLKTTGRGANQRGNNTSLFDYIEKHVTGDVRREGYKNYGKGVQGTIKKIVDIVDSEQLVDSDDLKTIKRYIKTLERIEKTDKLNPRNILFTVPDAVGKDGAESWKTVYGHYRTPEYVKHRKAKGKEEMGPAEGHWYSDDENTAEPPFWQALFATKVKDIPELNMGLLPLLKTFGQITSDPKEPITKVSNWHIKGKIQRLGIEKSEGFMNALSEVLGMQKCYRDATGNKPFDRLWINFTKTRDELRKKPIKVTDKDESDLVILYRKKDEFMDDEDKPNVQVVSYFVDGISDRLIRTILSNPNQQVIDLDNHPHQGLKGIFLHKPINEREKREELWNREQDKARKDGNLPFWARDEEDKEPEPKPKKDTDTEEKMLKSWYSHLWRD